MKALEARKVDGQLEIRLAGGAILLGLAAGHVVRIETGIQTYTFGTFLVRTRMMADAATADRVKSTRILVDQGVIRAEDASKLQASHIRSVLGALMSQGIQAWEFRPEPLPAGTIPEYPIDPCPELVRAVKAGDLAAMRPFVQRLRAGGVPELGPDAEACLGHIRSLIGDSRAATLLRARRGAEIDDGVLAEDDGVRTLFCLAVAGHLARHAEPNPAPAPGSPASPPLPASTPGLEVATSRQYPSSFSRLTTVPDSLLPAEESPGDPGLAVPGPGPASEVEKDLRSAAASMGHANHYEVLGVPVDARESAIRAAYRRAMRRFTRAKFEGLVPADALELLEHVQVRIEDAKDTLLDRAARLSYNRTTGVATSGLEARIVEMFEARALWKTGLDLLASHRGQDALAQFEAAARQDPGEPEFLAAQASAFLSLAPNPQNYQRARDLAKQALEADGELVSALVVLANLARMEGHLEEAQELVRRALKLEPDSPEAKAARELLKARGKVDKISFQKKPESLLDKVKGLFKRGP